MDYQSPMPVEQFSSSVVGTDISDKLKYMEYRQLVFQDLQSDYEKRKSSDYIPDIEIPSELNSFAYNMKYPISPDGEKFSTDGSVYYQGGDNTPDSAEESSKNSPSQPQPAWDESDLKRDLILSTPQKSHAEELEDSFNTCLLISSDDKHPKGTNLASDNENTQLLSDHNIKKSGSTSTESSLDSFGTSSTPPISPYSTAPKKRPPKSHILRQKNERRAVLKKLSYDDPEIDNYHYSNSKPWYNPKLERLNSQNLKICYINEPSSSSDSEESTKRKSSPSQPWAPPSPSITPLSPTLIRRNFLNRMQSTSSVSSVSSGGNKTSASSPQGDHDIINVRISLPTDPAPQKILTKEEEIDLKAGIAFREAQEKAKQLAKEERARSRKNNLSFDKLLKHFNETIRSKVKNHLLNPSDCRSLTISQLQVILNSMHAEKEALNISLKTILEARDELRTEQDAKLIDVEDLKAMLNVTGPETTV